MSAFSTYHHPSGFSIDNSELLPPMERRMSISREIEDFEGFMILVEAFERRGFRNTGNALLAREIRHILGRFGMLSAHPGFRSTVALGHLLLRIYDWDLGGVRNFGDLLAFKTLINSHRAAAGRYIIGTDVLHSRGPIEACSMVMDILNPSGRSLPDFPRPSRLGLSLLALVDLAVFPEYLERPTPYVTTPTGLLHRLRHSALSETEGQTLCLRTVAARLRALAGSGNPRVQRLSVAAGQNPIYRILPPDYD